MSQDGDEKEDKVDLFKSGTSSGLEHNTSMDSGGVRSRLNSKRGAFFKKGGVKDDFFERGAFHKKKQSATLTSGDRMLLSRRAKVDGRSEGDGSDSGDKDGIFAELGFVEGNYKSAQDLDDLERLKIGKKYVVYRANDPILKLT